MNSAAGSFLPRFSLYPRIWRQGEDPCIFTPVTYVCEQIMLRKVSQMSSSADSTASLYNWTKISINKGTEPEKSPEEYASFGLYKEAISFKQILKALKDRIEKKEPITDLYAKDVFFQALFKLVLDEIQNPEILSPSEKETLRKTMATCIETIFYFQSCISAASLHGSTDVPLYLLSKEQIVGHTLSLLNSQHPAPQTEEQGLIHLVLQLLLGHPLVDSYLTSRYLNPTAAIFSEETQAVSYIDLRPGAIEEGSIKSSSSSVGSKRRVPDAIGGVILEKVASGAAKKRIIEAEGAASGNSSSIALEAISKTDKAFKHLRFQPTSNIRFSLGEVQGHLEKTVVAILHPGDGKIVTRFHDGSIFRLEFLPRCAPFSMLRTKEPLLEEKGLTTEGFHKGSRLNETVTGLQEKVEMFMEAKASYINAKDAVTTFNGDRKSLRYQTLQKFETYSESLLQCAESDAICYFKQNLPFALENYFLCEHLDKRSAEAISDCFIEAIKIISDEEKPGLDDFLENIQSSLIDFAQKEEAISKAAFFDLIHGHKLAMHIEKKEEQAQKPMPIEEKMALVKAFLKIPSITRAPEFTDLLIAYFDGSWEEEEKKITLINLTYAELEILTDLALSLREKEIFRDLYETLQDLLGHDG